jgi:ribonuclease HI
MTGFPGPRCGSFKSREDAKAAFRLGSAKKFKEAKQKAQKEIWRQKVGTGIAVDAACAGVPGPTEWRGVMLPECTEIFHCGPYQRGTNNIGEFLAIVRGMQWLDERSLYSLPLFSDSMVGIGWAKSGKCNTHLGEGTTPALKLEIESAEQWLKSNPNVPKLLLSIKKWPTREYGEIPADFNRKK